jgi:hypothetical protein
MPSLEHPRPVKASDLADQFENSLVDFQLRMEIHSQTSSIRELKQPSYSRLASAGWPT